MSSRLNSIAQIKLEHLDRLASDLQTCSQHYGLRYMGYFYIHQGDYYNGKLEHQDYVAR